ncbi:Putative lipoprotein (modular protein) [Xanthomonas citri pv. citri]|nr:Putative lipoprotein (modular protein) [Xanthomonas citri pv. citri]
MVSSARAWARLPALATPLSSASPSSTIVVMTARMRIPPDPAGILPFWKRHEAPAQRGRGGTGAQRDLRAHADARLAALPERRQKGLPAPQLGRLGIGDQVFVHRRDIAQLAVGDVDIGVVPGQLQLQGQPPPAGQRHQRGQAAAECIGLVVDVGLQRRPQAQRTIVQAVDSDAHRQDQRHGDELLLQRLQGGCERARRSHRQRLEDGEGRHHAAMFCERLVHLHDMRHRMVNAVIATCDVQAGIALVACNKRIDTLVQPGSPARSASDVRHVPAGGVADSAPCIKPPANDRATARQNRRLRAPVCLPRYGAKTTLR